MEPEIVGRGPELQRLDQLIDGLEEHGGTLVLIGDAGIGKSTLLRAARDRAAAAGVLVLATTGIESEADLPYAGLFALLQPVLDASDALVAVQHDALLKAFGLEVGATPEPFLVALAALSLL